MGPGTIGTVCAVYSAVSVVAVPAFCAAFDTSRAQRRFWVAALLADAAIHASFPLLPAICGTLVPLHFAVLLFMIIIGEVLHGSTYSLLDTITLGALPDQLAYGSIRLWAGLLFAVSSFVMGLVIELPHFDVDVIFWCFGVCFLLLALLWCTSRGELDRRNVDGGSFEGCDAPRTEGADSAASGGSACFRLRRFVGLVDASLAELLLLVYCMGVANACMNTFVFLLIDDLGGSTVIMGSSILLNIATEVPIFQHSGNIITRIGARGVIYVGVLAHVLRLLGYALAPTALAVLLVEPLHGVTFALIWSNLATIGAQVAPPGLEGTTQGVINGIFNGLGGVTGMLAGGVIYARSPRMMFACVAGMMAATLPLMLASDLCRRRRRLQLADLSGCESGGPTGAVALRDAEGGVATARG